MRNVFAILCKYGVFMALYLMIKQVLKFLKCPQQATKDETCMMSRCHSTNMVYYPKSPVDQYFSYDLTQNSVLVIPEYLDFSFLLSIFIYCKYIETSKTMIRSLEYFCAQIVIFDMRAISLDVCDDIVCRIWIFQ